MRSKNKTFLALKDRVSLVTLEFPAVYKPEVDELYEVDLSGFQELSRCDGTYEISSTKFSRDFLDYCFSEGILVKLTSPSKKRIRIGKNEIPSLRYLMVEVTDRCNLSCAHCYVGEGKGRHIDISLFEKLISDFEDIGGLRLIITGGEPLMHPRFEEINRLAGKKRFRSILLTNGTLINRDTARSLLFDEVQVSIDGMRKGHEIIRGKGSFDLAVKGLQALKDEGHQISVATMIHRFNLDELNSLGSFLKEFGIIGWALDVPCAAGRLLKHEKYIIPEIMDAASYLNLSFGSGQHESTGIYACGAHLACVKVNGILTKCGFYDEWNGGDVRQGLRGSWLQLPKMLLSDLECDCAFIDECGGGCRYRAELHSSRRGPDPLACARFLNKGSRDS